MKDFLNNSLLIIIALIFGYFCLVFFRWNDTGIWDIARPYSVFTGDNIKEDTNQNTGEFYSGIIFSGITPDVNIWKDTTGAITEYGSGEEITGGAIIEIPEEPREYLEYIMTHGEGGIDYIIATPTDQPKMNSKIGTVNTQEMWNYIGNNKIKFDFDSKGKQGYIMFVTSRPISKAYKLFLGINGKTVGYIDANTKLSSYNGNEYLFKLDKLKYYWSGGNYKNADLSKSPIFINAVSSEAGNKVEKIIIFFK